MDERRPVLVGSDTDTAVGSSNAVALRVDQQLQRAQRYRRTGRLAEAEALGRSLLRVAPNHPDVFHLLGQLALQMNQPSIATAFVRKAVSLKPDEPSFHERLGATLVVRRRLQEAASAYEQALALDPRRASAYHGLALALLVQGRVDEAIPLLRRSVELAPGRSAFHSHLLMAMLYSPAYDRARILAEARSWASRRAVPRSLRTPRRQRSRDPKRRLRVGYVSFDFKKHPVAYLFTPVVSAHDREQVEVFCYTNSWLGDELTERIHGCADHWRSVVGLGDAEVARRIRADRIDILVDLTGHTAGNLLEAFLRRPAPIQMTWLGYSGTTGTTAIDYLIADHKVVPIGAEPWYTESIVRMPDAYLCYEPLAIAPAVGPLPMLSAGQVTFGSFNTISKVTPEVVAVWAEILRAVPGARLCLKHGALDDAVVRDRYLGLFAQQGVDQDRLMLIGRTSQRELFELYNQVDIALDPFPYNGTMTSLEALWMGVPVITLEGDRFVSRVGLSLLSVLDLEEFVARSIPQYVETAVELAETPDRLSELRAGLRSRMARSALLDGRRFTHHLEAVYRDIWRRWCHDGVE